MPGKRRYSGKNNRVAKRQRRSYGKSYGQGDYRPKVPRSMPGNRLELVTLPYVWRGVMNAAAGGVDTQLFNINSLFDPDRTGAGSQPNGFDQWAALYSRYTVFSCDWNVTAMAVVSTSDIGGGIMTAAVARTTAVGSTPSDIIACSDQWRAYSATGGGPAAVTIKGSTYIPNLMGHKYKVGEALFSALTSASPTNTCILIVQSCGSNDAVNPGDVSVTVKLSFKAVLSEAIRLTES